MTPGRMIAQGTHAAHYLSKIMERPSISDVVKKQFEYWKAETEFGFGTTIILKPNFGKGRQILEFKNLANISIGNHDIVCDTLTDPEYVIIDGDTVHYVPYVITGLIFFGKKSHLDMYGDYKLFDYDFKKE